MKHFFLLAALFSVFIVSATMSDPVELWPNQINMSEQNSISKLGNTTFLVFSDVETSEIVFGKLVDGEDIELQVVDISNNLFSLPTLLAIDEEHLFLAYSRNSVNNEVETIMAESTDGGETFLLNIQEQKIQNPVICEINGSIRMIGVSGSATQISNYTYLTDKETSVNADEGGISITKFWGRDYLRGDIHSNTDIWIQQAGGGDNNGWPTFHGFVSTSGQIRSYPGGGLAAPYSPMEDIFLGGYAENVPAKIIPDDLSELEENGTHMGEDVDILYIELNGDSYTGFEGTLEPRVEEFSVFSWFPADAQQAQYALDAGINWFEDSDLIYTNYVTVYDTIWTEISGDIADGDSYYTEADLWIKGSVAGKQVWGSSGKIRLLGDISYENTAIAEYPDGFSGYNENNQPEYNGTVNQTDYFGLVSKEVMNIAYKYRHPATGEVISVSTGNGNELYLYGSYAAVGIGDEELYGELACHYDGVFSFEYQHPHGSTPDFIAPSPFTGNDTLYTNVDLHKFIYPFDPMISPELIGFNIHSSNPGPINSSAGGYPNVSSEYLNSCPNNSPEYVYPLGTDYPWYNPVWPESLDDIDFERGSLQVIGSLTQRRRGFTHRSGSDDYNHPAGDNGWNMEQFHFGGDHSSTGFDKEYHFDLRFQNTELPNFIKIQNDFSKPELEIWVSADQGNTFIHDLTIDLNHSFAAINNNYEVLTDDETILFVIELIESTELFISIDGGENYTEHTISDEFTNPHLKDNILYYETAGAIKGYTLSDFELSFYDEDYTGSSYDYTSMDNNITLIDYSYDDELVSYLFTIDGGDSFAGLFTQPYVLSSNELEKCQIFGLNSDELLSVFYLDDQSCSYSKGSLDGITVQEPEEIPELKPLLSNHPNPFNPTTEIRFTAKDTDYAEIEIYNIKGQRIREFKMENLKCKMNKIIWNGTDQNNHPVASGIYYYTLKLDGKTTLSRKMVLLK